MMKSYEHMARDVSQRIVMIENARTRRRKRLVRGVAVMACAAVLDVGDWTRVTQVKGECSSGYGQVELALYVPQLAGQSVEYTLFTADGDHRLSKPVYGAGNCWLHGQGWRYPENGAEKGS